MHFFAQAVTSALSYKGQLSQLLQRALQIEMPV